MRGIDTRNQYYDVWNVYWPIALGVFVLIALIALGFILRYRSRSDEFPEGRDRNTPLEVGYAVFLSSIAAFLVFFTFSRMPADPEPTAAAEPLRVQVTAARWNWRFEYPGYGVTEQGTRSHVPVLRLPEDTPIRFVGSALDVIHSFWIPEARFKRDLFPGRRTRWQMLFERTAFWSEGGSCAEFCGLRHTDMKFRVAVLPRREFAGWAREAAR